MIFNFKVVYLAKKSMLRSRLFRLPDAPLRCDWQTFRTESEPGIIASLGRGLTRTDGCAPGDNERWL